MTPGLCLDSGEFIPAEELNQRIYMEHRLPPHPERTMQWSPREQRVLSAHFAHAIEPMQKRIAELEGMVHTCSPSCTKAGCVNQVLKHRVAELEVDNKSLRDQNTQLDNDLVDLEAQLASEREPVAWMVFWGLGKKRPGAIFVDRENAVCHAKQIKSETEIRPVYPHPAPAQQPVAWHENIKSLCDQYAQECVQFALGITAGSGSMSPIASLAGDTRLALHTAIDCAKPKPPAQQPLSEAQIHNADPLPHVMFNSHRIEFARAIEALHGIGDKT